MNKNRILIFIVILVVVGAGVIIQQQRSVEQVNQMEQQAIKEVQRVKIEQARLQAIAAEKAKQQAILEAQQAEAEVERMKQQSLEEARKAQEAARREAAALQAAISNLTTQAQSLLDDGQYQQAIDIAKNALSSDPGNPIAKSIIEKATVMLNEAVQEKAGALMGDAKGAVEGLGAGTPELGQ